MGTGVATPRTRGDLASLRGILRDHALRWGIKLAGLLVLLYYLLPTKVEGVPVWWAIPAGGLVLATLEAARLRWGFSLPSLRDYERPRVASYVYWAGALGLLVAFFPEGIAVPALVSAALADIAASLLRARGVSRVRAAYLTGLAFFAVSLPLLVGLVPEPVWDSFLVFPLLGGALAGPVEGLRIPGLDDDLLVPLLPALLWTGLTWVLPGATPLGFHLPWLAQG